MVKVSGLCLTTKPADPYVKCAKPTSVQCLLATSRATVVMGKETLDAGFLTRTHTLENRNVLFPKSSDVKSHISATHMQVRTLN